MKTAFLKYVLTFPMLAVGLGALGASLTYMEVQYRTGARGLSNNPKEYEITLNTMKLDPASRISGKENVFLRLRFDEKSALEIGRGQGWNLTQGGNIVVDQKIPVDASFIQGNETKFVLEVVYEQNVWGVTKADVALLRCNTIAKELSEYNRSYQCFIPGEKTPVVTYRLAEKGVPPPGAQSDSQFAGL